MFKKTTMILVSLLCVSSFPVGVFGEELQKSSDIVVDSSVINEVENSEINEVQEEEKELIDSLKSNDKSDYEELISDFVNSNNDAVAETVEENIIDTSAPEETPIVDFSDDVVENYEIDPETSVTITPTDIYLETLDVSNEVPVEEEISTEDSLEIPVAKSIKNYLFGEPAYAAYKARRKTATHTRTKYGKVSGVRVYSAVIGAEFTYNGAKVTGRTTKQYISNHNASGVIVKIRSQKNGMQAPSKTRRIAYKEANMTHGMTYKGQGIVWKTDYIRVNVECNKNGSIKKSSTLVG